MSIKKYLFSFLLVFSVSAFAQSWQSKPVVRIEDAGQSFLYTFNDSSNAYINKCNVSYIVNLPNSQWVQVGYQYDGSTSRIITASYSAITQPDLGSAKELSDTLNAWLRDCASASGGGGGGGTGFPKDLVTVTESRDFQSSDAGKILILDNDANLTMPAGSILQDGELIIVGVVNSATSVIERAPGVTLNMYAANDGSGNLELLLLEAINIDGQTILLPISTSVVDDNGVNKTVTRYLMDKSGDCIPLSGTVDGSPLTGDIKTYDGFNIYTPNDVNPNKKNGVYMQSSGVSIEYKNNALSSQLSVNENGVEITCSDALLQRGLISGSDFTQNITDLDYTQKKYVDTHIAFTIVPTSSTSTGKKGQMAVDASYLYICVDTDTWTRIALTW